MGLPILPRASYGTWEGFIWTLCSIFSSVGLAAETFGSAFGWVVGGLMPYFLSGYATGSTLVFFVSSEGGFTFLSSTGFGFFSFV